MKKNVVITGIIIATFGLSAFSIIGKSTEHKKNNLNLNTVSVVQADSITKQFVTDFSEIKTLPYKKNIQYLIQGNYSKPISKESLKRATSLSDIIPYYPSKWITDYTSVGISTIYNGKERKETSPNDVLSEAQKSMLNSADYSSNVNIIVKYLSENSVTKEKESQEMNVTMTIIPEVEAEFLGGYDQMITYLTENTGEGIDEKFSGIDIQATKPYTVLFTVNEKGEVENVRVPEIFGDVDIDLFFVELISNMPNWKPAESSNGSFVKQEFKFIAGLDGC